MRAYIDKEKRLFLTVQYTPEIKPLLLKMRTYYLSKEWEIFNEKIEAYQEAIFNSELADLGHTREIAQYADDTLLHTLFSQKNTQGIRHWWKEIVQEMECLDLNKSFLNQTVTHPITGKKCKDKLINNYGIELTIEFFNWYVTQYNKLKGQQCKVK